MCRSITLCLLIVSLAAARIALAGSLLTRDGNVFDGELRLDGPAAVRLVNPPGSGGFDLSFKLSDVSSIVFKPPMTGVLSGGLLAGDWIVQDVGTVGAAGSADYAEGVFTIRGEGTRFGTTNDSFDFVYHQIPADGEIIVRVASLSDTDPGAMAGIIMRQRLTADSPYTAIAVTAREGTQFITRPNSDMSGAVVHVPGPKIKAPCWLKLIKLNDTVIASQSIDGQKWQFVDRFAMGGLHNEYVGMFVSSHKPDALSTATFDKVKLTIHGLRGDYYGDMEFKDLRLVRIDPNVDFGWGKGAPDEHMPAADFSIRWTGQFEAPSTETFTFVLRADTAARLMINNQIIADTRSPIRRPGTLKLVAGSRNDIRIDYVAGNGAGSCRLLWSSPTQELQPIPTDRFFYAPEPGVVSPERDPALKVQSVPVTHGVLLTSGTFLPGTVKEADQKSVTLVYQDKTPLSLPVDRVSRVNFRPLNESALAKISARGGGMLNLVGDFLEGDCESIQGGKVKLVSVVFGASQFDTATQAAAVVFRPLAPMKAGWTIHTVNGGTFRAASVRVEKGDLVIDEPVLGSFTLRANELAEMRGE